MFRTTRISTFTTDGADRVHTVFRAVRSQPSWITRLALMTMLIVIGLPIFLLVMFALAAGVFVFGVLAGINLLLMRVRGAVPRRDGRQNVRVIQRVD